MKKEVKICMPYYKIAYSIAFVVILSAIQPVVYANEIGQAVERAVSLLAVVFCADTYSSAFRLAVLLSKAAGWCFAAFWKPAGAGEQLSGIHSSGNRKHWSGDGW